MPRPLTAIVLLLTALGGEGCGRPPVQIEETRSCTWKATPLPEGWPSSIVAYGQGVAVSYRNPADHLAHIIPDLRVSTREQAASKDCVHLFAVNGQLYCTARDELHRYADGGWRPDRVPPRAFSQNAVLNNGSEAVGGACARHLGSQAPPDPRAFVVMRFDGERFTSDVTETHFCSRAGGIGVKHLDVSLAQARGDRLLILLGHVYDRTGGGSWRSVEHVEHWLGCKALLLDENKTAYLARSRGLDEREPIELEIRSIGAAEATPLQRDRSSALFPVRRSCVVGDQSGLALPPLGTTVDREGKKIVLVAGRRAGVTGCGDGAIDTYIEGRRQPRLSLPAPATSIRVAVDEQNRLHILVGLSSPGARAQLLYAHQVCDDPRIR